MRTPPLVRVAAAAAAGMLALVGAATAAYAAAPTFSSTARTVVPLRFSTSLSIRAAHSTIHPGAPDVLSGVLLSGRDPLAKEIVELFGRAPGQAFSLDAVSVTGRLGSVSFTVKPAVTKQFKLAFPGSSTFRPSHSGVVTITVVGSTSLSIRAAKSTIHQGATDTVSGTLLSGKYGLPGETVDLFGRGAGPDFSLDAVGRTGAHGTVYFIVQPGATKHFKLVFPGSSSFLPSHSGVVTIVVVT
jgi:hypothetical protein